MWPVSGIRDREDQTEGSLPLGALGVDSLVLSLRTMFDARVAGRLVASNELWLGGDRFRAEVSDGRFEIERGPRTGARRSSRPFSARWPSSSMRAVLRRCAQLRGFEYRGRQAGGAALPPHLSPAQTDPNIYEDVAKLHK